jgi:hypothetical protein
LGLWALITTLWIEYWLGITRKRWIITWSTVVPVGLVRGFFHQVTMKFTVQWFLTLGLGILTIALLVQNAYTPGSTVVATHGVCIRADDRLWGSQKSVGREAGDLPIIMFFCLIVMLTVANGLR